MKKWVGPILLAASLVITYRGYHNSRNDPKTEEQSKTVACSVEAGCTLPSDKPRKVKTDFFQRQYEWGTSVGAVTVKCRRMLVWFGDWKCEATKGGL